MALENFNPKGDELGLELSAIPIERDTKKITDGNGQVIEKDILLINLAEAYASGDLYATQDWIKDKDIPTAQDFNSGIQTKDYQRFPTIFWARYQGRVIFLVGDGHHRVADAITKGIPLKGELDVELKDMTSAVLHNTESSKIKYARYGIEGIWPFIHFINLYSAKTRKPKSK